MLTNGGLMAKQARIKTKYPGVFLVDSISPATGKPDQIIYIRYKKAGKLIEERVGRTSVDAMTPAKAAQTRSLRMAGKSDPNTVKRAKEKAVKEAEAGRWTVERIWTAYNDAHQDRACAKPDAAYFIYILPELGQKTPTDLVTLDLERLRRNLAKTKSPRTGKTLAAQTQKHVLALLKRMFRWAADMGHIEHPHHLKFRMPTVDNEKTEFMTEDQLDAYLQALDEEPDQDDAAFFRIMLLTGIRRTALLNVQWSDLDLENGFLTLRGATAKNDKTQTVPLSPGAVAVLKSITPNRYTDGEKYGEIIPFVWPGKGGDGPREDFRRMGRRLRDKAGLPKDFRPCHGLRHHFASMLASSGKVDLYSLQKLLTHGSSAMTQRYAHLSDEVLKRAISTADEMMDKRRKVTRLQSSANEFSPD